MKLLTEAEAVDAINASGVVAFSTESFMGLGALISSHDAVAEVARLKGRNGNKPIAVIASDFEALERHFHLSSEELRLAEVVWPGAVTIILKVRHALDLSRHLQDPYGGIGVRIPQHASAVSLARECGGIITATSANPADQSPVRSPQDLLRRYPEWTRSLSGIAEGVCGTETKPSTLLRINSDTTPAELECIRVGAVDPEHIKQAVFG